MFATRRILSTYIISTIKDLLAMPLPIHPRMWPENTEWCTAMICSICSVVHCSFPTFRGTPRRRRWYIPLLITSCTSPSLGETKFDSMDCLGTIMNQHIFFAENPGIPSHWPPAPLRCSSHVPTEYATITNSQMHQMPTKASRFTWPANSRRIGWIYGRIYSTKSKIVLNSAQPIN